MHDEVDRSRIAKISSTMTGSTSGWATGIPSIRYVNSDQYGGGSYYTRVDGDPSTISLSASRDFMFHVDMVPFNSGTIFLFK